MGVESMSRRSSVGVLLAVLGQLGLAQVDPSQLRYDTANFHTYFVTPHGVNWQTARTYSRSFGGYLASINDPAEAFFIDFNYSNYPALWIGLTDAQLEGAFIWDSGEPLTYLAWCGGEPNNFGNEDYVEALFTGYAFCWNDIASPYNGPNSAPDQALIEIPFGHRVNFDYSQTVTCAELPHPFGAAGNPDGVSWNGAGGTSSHKAYISTLGNGNMPVTGSGYLLVEANGPVTVPLYGPFPRPASPLVNEVRIPIPPGTKGVSYTWELLSAENTPSAFNDGISIAVVDANGVLLQDLSYADAATPKELNVPAVPYCSNPPVPVTPVGVSGPQTAAYAFLPLPYPAYLSIVCWNGSDNSLSGSAAVDAIQFWGEGKFTLTISAPNGPGSISIVNFAGGAFNTYTTAVSLTQGNFPYGWLFGIDIGLDALFSQMAAGPPFHGTLSAGGASFFTLPSGVPSGLAVYAVSMQFASPGPFGGTFVSATSPEFFLTP
jgi:hypothetical protein